MSALQTPSVGKTILLAVSGSIAAYKAADLVSQLVKRQHSVHVVMTRNAEQFIGPLTFQTLSRNPVTVSVFEEKSGWQPTHIDLADRADLFVVAPATANIIAKMAYGIADDAVSTLALAITCSVLIAPAMNGKMWLHPATQANVKTLESRGAQWVGPETGALACGYEGIGRLCPIEAILQKIDDILQ